MSPQETDSDLPVSVQEDPAEVACYRVGDTECGSVCMDLLKEISIIFITSSIVWSQVNNREGSQPHPSTKNWIKDLLSMAPPIRTRPNFLLSISLSHQEASYLYPSESRQNENHNQRKLIKMIT